MHRHILALVVCSLVALAGLLRAEDTPAPTVELYDVQDIASPPGCEAGEPINVAEIVRTTLPGVRIEGNAGILEVTSGREAQSRVREVLETLRANRQTMISVQARLVGIRFDHRGEMLRRAGIGVRHDGPDAPWYSVLDPLQAQILLARIGHEEDEGWQVACPFVRVFHAQRASMSIASQTAYVKDYESQSPPVPVIGIATDGALLDLRVVRSSDGRLRVVGRAKTSTLLALEDLPVGNEGLSVQMPHLQEDTLEFNAEMADGQTLVLYGGLRASKGGKPPKTAMWLRAYPGRPVTCQRNPVLST